MHKTFMLVVVILLLVVASGCRSNAGAEVGLETGHNHQHSHGIGVEGGVTIDP